MTTPITPFVSWEIPTFEKIQDCKAVALRRRLDSGSQLTREEKDWITTAVNGNAYFRDAIPVVGYKVPFRDVLRRFFVKQYGHIQEYFAIDKTAIRNMLAGRIDEIIEVKPQ